MHDKNKNHPELRDGEIFYGNYTIESYSNILHESKRIGVQAFNDTNGNPFINLDICNDHGKWYPVFIKKEKPQ